MPRRGWPGSRSWRPTRPSETVSSAAAKQGASKLAHWSLDVSHSNSNGVSLGTAMCRTFGGHLKAIRYPGLTAGSTFCRPFGPKNSTIFASTAHVLSRAEGPAESSHARKGVVWITDEFEGRRPDTD